MSTDALTSADPHLDNDVELLSALKTVNNDADRELAPYDHCPGAWSYLGADARARLEARRDARAVISRASTLDLARAEQRLTRKKERPTWLPQYLESGPHSPRLPVSKWLARSAKNPARLPADCSNVPAALSR